MGANKYELKRKLRIILGSTITIVISILTIMHVYIRPSLGYNLEDATQRNILYSIYFISTILLSGTITVLANWIANIYLKKRKGKLHGWWAYCFLFPATKYDKEHSICFSISDKEENIEENVLVVGYTNIYQDVFELNVIDNYAVSKTFLKDGAKLYQRVTLSVKNIDSQSKLDLTINYETNKSRFVEKYNGQMKWKSFASKTFIKTPFSKKHKTYNTINTTVYQGLIEDTEIGRNIVKNTIYLQHLKYEKNELEVEKVLTNNLDIIKSFVLEYFPAKEI